MFLLLFLHMFLCVLGWGVVSVTAADYDLRLLGGSGMTPLWLYICIQLSRMLLLVLKIAHWFGRLFSYVMLF